MEEDSTSSSEEISDVDDIEGSESRSNSDSENEPILHPSCKGSTSFRPVSGLSTNCRNFFLVELK